MGVNETNVCFGILILVAGHRLDQSSSIVLIQVEIMKVRKLRLLQQEGGEWSEDPGWRGKDRYKS